MPFVPTPSEEDRSFATSVMQQDREALATTVQQYMADHTHEWLAAVLVDAQQAIIETPHVLYRGQHCPISPAVNHQGVLSMARQRGASQMITVRYHPHAPRLRTKPDYDRFHAFRLAAKQAGVPLLNHWTLDCTGTVMSWRDFAYRPSGRGTSFLSASAARVCSSTIMAAISMTLTGSG
jgi:DNA repair protein RadC